jgi:hypothetical protein
LLDTHALIWASITPERLGVRAARVLQEQRHELYVSVASFWEISIKVSKPQHVLTLPAGWEETNGSLHGAVGFELASHSAGSLSGRARFSLGSAS